MILSLRVAGNNTATDAVQWENFLRVQNLPFSCKVSSNIGRLQHINCNNLF